jgi:hypothetical protein
MCTTSWELCGSQDIDEYFGGGPFKSIFMTTLVLVGDMILAPTAITIT